MENSREGLSRPKVSGSQERSPWDPQLDWHQGPQHSGGRPGWLGRRSRSADPQHQGLEHGSLFVVC
jgi:hypothetical protein